MRTSLRCFLIGHNFEQYKNMWNDGTWLVCNKCGKSIYKAKIPYKIKED